MIVTLALAASLLFPNVQARDLTGKTVVTQQQSDAPLVYVIGFTHDQKAEAREWREALSAESAEGLRVIEMPVLSGMAVVMRPVIENALVRKTPPAQRPDVMTTTDRDAFVASFKLDDPDTASVVALVDTEGVVRYVGRGGPTPASKAELVATWRKLVPTP